MSMVNALVKLLLLVILLPAGQRAYAQEIVNQVAGFYRKEGTNFNVFRIKFDLVSVKDDNMPYVVKLRFIDKTNNTSYYLKKVTGDFNKLIYPGPNKQIEWDQNDELVFYRGDPLLELEVVPALQVDRKVKRGRDLVVIADPLIVSDSTYTLALYKNKRHFGTLADTATLKAYSMVALPKNTPKKRFQLAYVGSGKNIIFSNSFKVKPKISNWFKVLPIIIGGGVAGYLWYDKQTEPLPAPPIPQL